MDNPDTETEGYDLSSPESLSSSLKVLPQAPGVYCFYDNKSRPLYVGKAKCVRTRVKSYFASNQKVAKTLKMVEKAQTLRVHVVSNEVEALILEQTLIKSLAPPYNVLMRDDKSYPYIWITTQQEYPRLAYYRGSRPNKGRLFGPFPSGTAVRQSLNILQKIFKVRQCEDAFFRNRSRPCLQYQIHRCTAPCVGRISAEAYRKDVDLTMKVLDGKYKEVVSQLTIQMEASSAALDFEMAAELRDKIHALSHVQNDQSVEIQTSQSWDIVWVEERCNEICLLFVFIRDGRMIGTKAYFPRVLLSLSLGQVVDDFMNGYYMHGRGHSDVPDKVWVNLGWASASTCVKALDLPKKKLKLVTELRGVQKQWSVMAQKNATHQLERRLNANRTNIQRFESLAEALGLDSIDRIECFDVSHSSGEETVAVSVSLGPDGPIKSSYRRYLIRSTSNGDDYEAMAEVVRRRFANVNEGDTPTLPDLLLVDGGRGQLSRAITELEKLGRSNLMILGVAKGRDRRDGFEELVQANGSILKLKPNDSARLVIQQVRDEAHRFAITGHRLRRDKKRRKSMLEDIPGVGAKRRKALLLHFGSLNGIQAASIGALSKVPGISEALAKQIHGRLQSDNN